MTSTNEIKNKIEKIPVIKAGNFIFLKIVFGN